MEPKISSTRPIEDHASLPSAFFDERAQPVQIDTIIIHSMFNPQSEDYFSAYSCKDCLDSCEVSVHYIIDRAGVVWLCVPEEKRAWHAGQSRIPDPEDGREGVNHFSIGVELIGTEDSGFTQGQYNAISRLTSEIAQRHPIRQIYGHADIAPQRKSDPLISIGSFLPEAYANLAKRRQRLESGQA